jgi:hypothetical protein
VSGGTEKSDEQLIVGVPAEIRTEIYRRVSGGTEKSDEQLIVGVPAEIRTC